MIEAKPQAASDSIKTTAHGRWFFMCGFLPTSREWHKLHWCGVAKMDKNKSPLNIIIT
jgi:hypothetical protein